MRTSIAKLFPNAKFSEKGEWGVFVLGVQSQQFAIPPNFGSFESGEEQKEEIVRVSKADPNPDPNYFESENKFESVNDQKSNPDATDLNKFSPDANKPDNHDVLSATDANYSKSTYCQPTQQQPPIKIGDRVGIFRLKTACEKFKKDLPPDGYIVREIAGNNGSTEATIKHPKMKASYVIPAEWLYVEEVKV